MSLRKQSLPTRTTYHPNRYQRFRFGYSHSPSGNAEVTEVSTQGRLDSDMIATAGGLAAVALFLLSLRYSFFPKSHKPETDNPIDGTGVLQAIWLYRNHPELETQLVQVDNPTETNLRKAGMVRTRLVGAGRRRRETCESALSPPQIFTMLSSSHLSHDQTAIKVLPCGTVTLQNL
ncbi:hypothetical protein B0H14DRAFT_116666 [Mycena olivaceomarginata]|nr:hypothetical protein B0H14DRAFT_116666 [Mycena olivaceomarginata]